LKTGLIVAQSVGRLDHLDVDFLSVNAKKVTRDLVQRLHNAGKQIHVWTVNSRELTTEMLDLRVDNIITDDPEMVRDVLNEWKELSNTERLLLAFHQRLKER
jgi:glycerophosphoryl diester phosphodiesterase